MNGSAVLPYRTIRYVPEFDGLRGFALLVVVISHTAILYPLGRWSTIPGGFLPKPLQAE